MKSWGLFFVSMLLVFGCNNSKTNPQPPNVNWTQFDEPPLYSECPKEDVATNWKCFAKILQQKLDRKLAAENKILASFPDTLFITLKVDTIGNLSIVDYSNKKSVQIPSNILSELISIIDSLPLFEPAFKTNLEVPVEVQWTLPIAVSK